MRDWFLPTTSDEAEKPKTGIMPRDEKTEKEGIIITFSKIALNIWTTIYEEESWKKLRWELR